MLTTHTTGTVVYFKEDSYFGFGEASAGWRASHPRDEKAFFKTEDDAWNHLRTIESKPLEWIPYEKLWEEVREIFMSSELVKSCPQDGFYMSVSKSKMSASSSQGDDFSIHLSEEFLTPFGWKTGEDRDVIAIIKTSLSNPQKDMTYLSQMEERQTFNQKAIELTRTLMRSYGHCIIPLDAFRGVVYTMEPRFVPGASCDIRFRNGFTEVESQTRELRNRLLPLLEPFDYQCDDNTLFFHDNIIEDIKDFLLQSSFIVMHVGEEFHVS